jgi:hypothetical protein
VLAVPTPPVNATDPADLIQYEIWKLSVEKHKIKEQEYSNFRAGLFKVIFGQCTTKALQDKLKSHSDFPNAYKDGIALLTIIKTLTGLPQQIDSEAETGDFEDKMYRQYGRTGADDAVAPMLGHLSVVSRAPTVVSCLTGNDDMDMTSRMGVEPTSLVFGKDGVEAVMKEMLVVSWAPTAVSCLTGTDDLDTHDHLNVDLSVVSRAPTVVSCLTGNDDRIWI